MFTKRCLLILFREISAVYFQKHKKHINEFCGQNEEFLNVTVVHMVNFLFCGATNQCGPRLGRGIGP
jgi:hypothetical protein